MIFISDSAGSITCSLPENVYQGSNRANEIVLLAPFPKTAIVTVGFRLPNGALTTPDIADASDEYRAKVMNDLPTGIQDKDGNAYNVWAFTLNRPVTSLGGNLRVQFYIYTGTDGEGQAIATSPATLPVINGVPYINPSATAPADIWNKVVALIAAAQSALDANFVSLYDESGLSLAEATPGKTYKLDSNARFSNTSHVSFHVFNPYTVEREISLEYPDDASGLLRQNVVYNASVKEDGSVTVLVIPAQSVASFDLVFDSNKTEKYPNGMPHLYGVCANYGTGGGDTEIPVVEISGKTGTFSAAEMKVLEDSDTVILAYNDYDSDLGKRKTMLLPKVGYYTERLWFSATYGMTEYSAYVIRSTGSYTVQNKTIASEEYVRSNFVPSSIPESSGTYVYGGYIQNNERKVAPIKCYRGYAGSGDNGSVPRRGGTGQSHEGTFEVKDATTDKEPVTLGQAQKAYVKKTSASEGQVLAYVSDNMEGQGAKDETVEVSVGDGAFTIAQRDSSGGLYVGNAKYNGEAVNLGQADGRYLKQTGGKVTGNVEVTGDLNVGGKLSYAGEAVEIHAEKVTVKDHLIELGKDNPVPLVTPSGMDCKYSGTQYSALVWDGNGYAYVGDVVFDANGNIDVANSDLHPLALRALDTALEQDSLLIWDAKTKTIADSGIKVADITVLQNSVEKAQKTADGAVKKVPHTDTWRVLTNLSDGAEDQYSPELSADIISDSVAMRKDDGRLAVNDGTEDVDAVNVSQLKTKLDKKTNADGLYHIYAFTDQQTELTADAEPNPLTVPVRNDKGEIMVPTLTYNDNSAPSLYYVNATFVKNATQYQNPPDYIVYGRIPTGEALLEFGSSPRATTIPLFDTAGKLYSETPLSSDSLTVVANKAYVDGGFVGKLQSHEGEYKVYANKPDGDGYYLVSNGAVGGTLAERTGDGDVIVPSVPSSVQAATAKEYVDKNSYAVVTINFALPDMLTTESVTVAVPRKIGSLIVTYLPTSAASETICYTNLQFEVGLNNEDQWEVSMARATWWNASDSKMEFYEWITPTKADEPTPTSDEFQYNVSEEA